MWSVEDMVEVTLKERDDFLKDLELPERQLPVSNPVGRHLQHVFEERDTPAHEDRHHERLRAEVFQVRVPRERHEDVRADQEQNGLEKGGHATSVAVGVRSGYPSRLATGPSD